MQELEDINTPKEVHFDDDINVVDVVAGDTASAVITKQGYLYTWGKNDFGQLGLNVVASDKPNHIFPAKVVALDERVKFKKLAMATAHSIALCGILEIFLTSRKC